MKNLNNNATGRSDRSIVFKKIETEKFRMSSNDQTPGHKHVNNSPLRPFNACVNCIAVLPFILLPCNVSIVFYSDFHWFLYFFI